METACTDKTVLRDYLVQELPAILAEEPEVRNAVAGISRERFADRDKTDERFERMFEELRKDRESNNRKWEEQNREFNRKWEEQNRQFNQKWEETNKRLDDSMRQSDERFAAMLQEIKDIRTRQESSVGALGARWGIAAESSFRNALKAILENRFDVQVINVTEYDHEGFVFGRPDQVELDIIIRNGEILVCEIKSSMSRSDMYTFEKKVRFYEKQHTCKVSAMMVISPMVDRYAQTVAQKLGIEVYSYSEDVRL